MRKILLTLVLTISIVIGAWAQDVPQIINVMNRQAISLNGDWNTQDERLFFYEGTVWFQRYFDYQPQGDRRALLYFGAVNYDCHVYVNGKKAGHHVGGFTPFNFDA